MLRLPVTSGQMHTKENRMHVELIDDYECQWKSSKESWGNENRKKEDPADIEDWETENLEGFEDWKMKTNFRKANIRFLICNKIISFVSLIFYRRTPLSIVLHNWQTNCLNCGWLLIPEVQWLSCTQELLEPEEKFTVRMPMVRLELANPQIWTECFSHWAKQLKCYCWEGVEFIQLVYCIIIYLSFLNCGWLLIREVQWFYWTKEFLLPAEKFTVSMLMVRPELTILWL